MASQDAKPSPEPHPLKLLGSMKRDPTGMGIFWLGGDGVMRSFTGPWDRLVVDAIGLSPSQLKKLLDMGPWSQEREDEFRGVDGRKVTNHEALFNPPWKWRPQLHTEESWAKAKEEVKLKNEKLREERKQAEREGRPFLSCTAVVSDYDLGPRETSK